MIKLPPNGNWFQNNRSDIQGSLAGSFNVNLTEQMGKLKVSPRMCITTNQVNGGSNMGTPVAFGVLASVVYAMCPVQTGGATGIYEGSNLSSAFTVNAGTGSGATTYSCDYSDLCVFNSKVVVTGSQDIIYGDGVGWTTSGGHGDILSSVLTASVPHKLLNFPFTGRLYVTSNVRQILSMSTAFALNSIATANSLTILNPELFITSMVGSANRIYVLTVNQYGTTGYVYIWDGITADVATGVPLDSRGALAGIVKDGTPYIINTNGSLQYFNGGTFVDAPNGQLPIKQYRYLKNPVSSNNNRWIHPNGISIVEGRINILVNNENYDGSTGTINEFLPSGIWEYVQAGANSYWYHKSALSKYDYSDGAVTVTDYGQNRLSRVGALFNVKKDDNSGNTRVGTLLAGADYFNTATATKSAIFTNDSNDVLQKYGYLVTAKLFAASIQEDWRKLYINLKKLLSATDKVIVKYRYTDDIPTEATITWVDGTAFTSTADLSAYAIGDEVEGISGGGAGRCAHITDIVLMNPTTYSVTIDETLGTSTVATAKVRFQHWKKLGTFASQQLPMASFADMGQSAWIQLKICMLFTGNNEIYNLIVDNAKAA